MAPVNFLAHRAPCPSCTGRLLFCHCNPCHRLFLYCERCEREYPDAIADTPTDGTPEPPPEHPTCPRCATTGCRPASRSDLEARGLLDRLSEGPG
ncbi:MAG: hypothetical protein ACLGIN_03640 [Candidatus Sericytochromatia bacterium]